MTISSDVSSMKRKTRATKRTHVEEPAERTAPTSLLPGNELDALGSRRIPKRKLYSSQPAQDSQPTAEARQKEKTEIGDRNVR